MGKPALMDAEAAVIGIAMESREAIAEMNLTPEDFAAPRLRELWRLIVSMDRDSQAVTPAAVAANLARIPEELRRGVDGPFLFECWSARPIAALAYQYAKIVSDDAARRRVSAAIERGKQLIEAGESPDVIAEFIRGQLDTAHANTSAAHLIGHTIQDTLAGYDEPTKAVPTPWADLNRLIAGWAPGRLYIVGARPGVGKSIVGLQAAVGLCKRGSVAFHSLEMTSDEVNDRVIAQLAQVPLGRLGGRSPESPPLSSANWEHIARVMPTIQEMPLSVDDSTDVTVTGIRSHVRRLARQGPVAGVVVDYLQLMQPERGDRRQRYEIVGEFSRELKNLAKEFSVPVIALAQLGRESEKANRPPMLSDLRESGSLEQDANVVLLLHATDERPDQLDMAVAKNRHGVRGPVPLKREGEFARAIDRPWKPSHAMNYQGD